ncbi:MAG: hypothetical protein WA970_12175 [Gammaproteobacteria bacterium]
MKEIFIHPGLSATAKTIFVILNGLALSPEEDGGGQLAKYLKEGAGGTDVSLASLAAEFTKYMKEDIGEIERAMNELEEYWRENGFSAKGFWFGIRESQGRTDSKVFPQSSIMGFICSSVTKVSSWAFDR